MIGYTWFKTPDSNCFHCVEQHKGSIKELYSFEQLASEEGFVIAPFSPTTNCPIVVLHPDECSTHSFPTLESCELYLHQPQNEHQRKAYAEVFRKFHTALLKQQFSKLVLSRTEEYPLHITEEQAKQLFLHACARYPHLFVALINTPKTGLWLMATPETLIEQTEEGWQTMALAGTQKIEKEWFSSLKTGESPHDLAVVWQEKEQKEQQIVTDYIVDCLKKVDAKISISKPHTVFSAELAHLRTDISFHLTNKTQLGKLLNSLHPTPAVCCLPQQEAKEFILKNEGYHRKYYSGFVGMMNVNNFKTHLFVTLRCLNIAQEHITFYAGGGLLAASKEENEWQETENKLRTMKDLFVEQ